MNAARKLYLDSGTTRQQISEMDLQGDRDEAAAIYQHVFKKDGRLVDLGAERSAVSRAKDGTDNHSARMMRLLRFMHAAGYSTAERDLLLQHLRSFNASLDKNDVTEACLLQESYAEQASQGDEDEAQLAVHEARTPERLERVVIESTRNASHSLSLASTAQALLRKVER